MSFCGLTAHFFLSLNNIPLYENVPLTAFFIIFFSQYRVHSRITLCMQLSHLFSFLSAGTIPQFFLTLIFLSTGQLFYRRPLKLGFADVSSCLQLGHVLLAGMVQERCCVGRPTQPLCPHTGDADHVIMAGQPSFCPGKLPSLHLQLLRHLWGPGEKSLL